MAMVTTVSWHGRVFAAPLLQWRYLLTTPQRRHGLDFQQCQSFRGVVRALSGTTTSESPKSTSGAPEANSDGKNGCIGLTGLSLACPICYRSLLSDDGQNSFRKKHSHGSNLECKTCKKIYNINETYLDLTVSYGSDEFIQSMPGGTELFRSPVVSFLYERGWRQIFPVAGYPGPEKEFEMASDYLKTTFGGTVVDASCGSGLFSRMFSKSGFYKYVVALDFSENMLKQCSGFIRQEGMSTDNIMLVRADVSRLPFESGSIDAVHAGAALHCWPSPAAAMAEISRVLRPGGVFVGTTSILDGIYGTGFPFSLASPAFNLVTGQNLFTSEGQLEDLCTATGLAEFTRVRSRFFVMISATKPS